MFNMFGLAVRLIHQCVCAPSRVTISSVKSRLPVSSFSDGIRQLRGGDKTREVLPFGGELCVSDLVLLGFAQDDQEDRSCFDSDDSDHVKERNEHLFLHGKALKRVVGLSKLQ